MGVKNAPLSRGREAAKGLREEAREEEHEVEEAKGSDLKKGRKRFEERADSAEGDRGVKPSS